MKKLQRRLTNPQTQKIMLFRTLPVEVWFFDSVRKTPPCGNTYRPHFVVKGTNDYLGIQFEYLEDVPFREHIAVRVQLTYESTGVDYSKLKPNVTFEIKEGGTIVGEGIVIGNKSAIVEYAQWEMECCGDPFEIGNIVEWQIEKAGDLQIKNLFVNGLIDYCYSAHASIDDEVFILKAKILDIHAVYYEREIKIINTQGVLFPISGKAFPVNKTEWNSNDVPDSWFINLDIINIKPYDEK